jgi:hypothetical protein
MIFHKTRENGNSVTSGVPALFNYILHTDVADEVTINTNNKTLSYFLLI